jgi:hypothetical protein
MKNTINMVFFGKSAAVSLLLVIGIFFVLGFACGKGDGKPVPSEYVGAWTGDDGSTLTIRGDSSGDYKSGATSVSGGTVAIGDDNKLSITFVGVGPSFTIDKAPSGNQMTLSGVVYRKSGGSDTKSDTKTDSDKSSSSDTSSSKGDVPSDDKLQSLAKTTLMDFNEAVQSGDFSDFHDTLSKPFQKQASADKIAGVFNEFVEKKVDFSSAKSMKATFNPAPEVTKEGTYKVLNLKGTYPTSPRKTNFNFKYIDEDGEWKLSSIDINTKDQ